VLLAALDASEDYLTNRQFILFLYLTVDYCHRQERLNYTRHETAWLIMARRESLSLP